MTELRKISPKERRAEKLGRAIEYELTHDHMGAHAGRDKLSVYLGRAHIVELHDLLAIAAGKVRESIAEQLWDDLMATYERLIGEYGDLTDTGPEEMTDEDQELIAWGEARGRAQGVALALAVLVNPDHPNIEDVRAETFARWQASVVGPAAS